MLEAQRSRTALVFPDVRKGLIPFVLLTAKRFAAAIFAAVLDGGEDCVRSLVELNVAGWSKLYRAQGHEHGDDRATDRVQNPLVNLHEHTLKNFRIDEIARMVGQPR